MGNLDAYPGEMDSMRGLGDRELERLLSGRSPDGAPELDELVSFIRAVPAVVLEAPDPTHEATLVPRLAEIAAAAPSAPRSRPAHGRSRGPLALALRFGAAVALLPACLAGIAFAGVSLPGPAQDAFESVGIELPNQAGGDDAADHSAADDQSDSASDHDGDSAGKGNDNGKHLGATNRRSHRRAYGPSRSAIQNPPGAAVRRGPNPTPGTPPGKPDTLPPPPVDVGGGSPPTAPAVGKHDGRGRNG
jgi:hypothetical protein